MTDREYLWCALNLLLDDEEKLDGLCPSCRAEALGNRCAVCGTPLGDCSGGENAGFDSGRYEVLKRGKNG